MEKSVEFEIADYIKEVLEMKEVEPEGYSPLTLAYIGDSIYDLIIKTKVIRNDHTMRTCKIGSTDDRAEIMWILNIVQKDRKRSKKA